MPENLPGTPRDQERLARYWDHLTHGMLPEATPLDPTLTAAIRRFHTFAAQDAAPGPDPAFVHRLMEQLMDATSANRSLPSPLPANPAQAISPNGRMAWPLRQASPHLPASRSRWLLAQLATAALLVLTLVASFFAFGPGQGVRQGDAPAFVPAISATPATPSVSQTPIAEFLWQADGGPEFRLGEPSHLTIDPQGNIWVPDGYEHRFLIYAPDGTLVEAWGTPGTEDGDFDFELGGIPAGAVGFDADGNIYVVDSGNSRIQKFGPDRSFLLAWGSAGRGEGQFQFPVDVAIDRQGRVLVSDYSSGAIQVFDDEGTWQATWGSYGADPGELSGPTGITADASGNLWVAEHSGGRVQKFSPDGESLMIWGGAEGAEQEFSSPTDVAVDDQGRVFISDRSNRVQVFSAGGELLGSWGEPGTGESQFLGPFGLALDGADNAYVAEDSGKRLQAFRLLPPFAPDAAPSSNAATPAVTNSTIAEYVWETAGGPGLPFDNKPLAAAVDPDGNLWVVDGARSQFQIFAPDGTYLESWGTPGSGDGQFSFLMRDYGDWSTGDVAFDADGNLYVADPGNFRIQMFAPDRTFLAAWGNQGGGEGQFRWPGRIVLDEWGRVYVSDEMRHDVQVFDRDGRYLQTIGGFGQGDGQLNFPAAVARDSTGNLWVADTGHDTMQQFSPQGAIQTAWGTPGYGPGDFINITDVAIDAEDRLFVLDGGAERVKVFTPGGVFLGGWGGGGNESGAFLTPSGIVLDGDGNAYVSDYGNARVQKFRLVPFAPAATVTSQATPAPELVWQLGGGPDLPFDDPYKVAIGPQGNLWVPGGSSGRFLIFAPDGTFLETWGTPGSGDGQFNFDYEGYGYGAVIWDEEGNFYVADTGNFRIQKFAPDRTFITAWGGHGQEDGQFLGMGYLAMDRKGRIYAADHGRDDIQVFDRDGLLLDAWGGFGFEAGQLSNPGGIALDADGNFYISEFNNNRIQKFAPDGTSLAVWGSYGADEGEFSSPNDVAVDELGRVYVADWGNGRVRVFDPDGRFLTAWGDMGLGDGQFLFPTGVTPDGAGSIYVADESGDRVQKFRLVGP